MHAFDVLGDPVRRRILELLAEGELTSGAVVAVIRREFGISQPAAIPAAGRTRDSASAISGYRCCVAESIRQSELRNNNAEIMRRVADGESFTVTVHGRPVADLVPHQRTPSRRRRLVPAADLDRLFAGAGRGPDPAAWAEDMAAADDVFGDEGPVDPWERGEQR